MEKPLFSPRSVFRRLAAVIAVVPSLALPLAGAALAQEAVPYGVEFVVNEINNNPPEEGVRHTLTFRDASTIGGNAGCNEYSAGYTAVDELVIFQPPRMTRMACTPEAMKAEEQFLAYLLIATSFHYDAEKGTLDLNGANGRPVIRLSAL